MGIIELRIALEISEKSEEALSKIIIELVENYGRDANLSYKKKKNDGATEIEKSEQKRTCSKRYSTSGPHPCMNIYETFSFGSFPKYQKLFSDEALFYKLTFI